MSLFGSGSFQNKDDQPTHGSSMWLVWLLSIVTFFGTVAVVLLLFWGGRWVVHKVQNRNQQAPPTTPTAQKQTSGSANQSPQARSGTNQNGSSSGSSSNTSKPPSSAAPKSTSPSGGSSANGTPGSAAAGSPASGTTPNTGPGLINTGPTSDD